MLSDSGDHYSFNTFIIYGTLFGGVFGINWLFALNTCLALIVGLLVLYMGASELLKSLGMPGLPAGKPFRKLPEYPSGQ